MNLDCKLAGLSLVEIGLNSAWKIAVSGCQYVVKVLDTLFSEQAYLSAIIIYLYAHDFKQAEKCYNDCSQ